MGIFFSISNHISLLLLSPDKKAFFLINTSSAAGPQIYELCTNTSQERQSWIVVILSTQEVQRKQAKGWRRNAKIAANPRPLPQERLPVYEESSKIDEKPEINGPPEVVNYVALAPQAEVVSLTNSSDDTDRNDGNDDQLTSLKHDSESKRDDIYYGGLSAPPEILARGPRAQRAYAEAAQAGTKKVFRTRLMLVGQERVGKTSLKKNLTGQGFDQNEEITDGVETTNAYDICIEIAKAGEKMWSIHKKGHGNEDTKEDEYIKAVADKIAKSLTVTPPQS
eukprot:XP_011670796.1 PREDICTED: uncharacterized protein LOC105441410 [Strongylocentrotus purpuratus]